MSRLDDLGKALGFGAAVGTRRGRQAVKLGGRGAVFLAKRHPVGFTLTTLATLGYIHRDEIPGLARELAQRMPRPRSGQGGSPTFGGGSVFPKLKRKASKANKAMSKAMKATKNNFKQATKIASKANPNTKSKIGKGSTKVKKLARKIRKSVWGSLRRKK